jgi:hypothetical protein
MMNELKTAKSESRLFLTKQIAKKEVSEVFNCDELDSTKDEFILNSAIAALNSDSQLVSSMAKLRDALEVKFRFMEPSSDPHAVCVTPNKRILDFFTMRGKTAPDADASVFSQCFLVFMIDKTLNLCESFTRMGYSRFPEKLLIKKVPEEMLYLRELDSLFAGSVYKMDPLCAMLEVPDEMKNPLAALLCAAKEIVGAIESGLASKYPQMLEIVEKKKKECRAKFPDLRSAEEAIAKRMPNEDWRRRAVQCVFG